MTLLVGVKPRHMILADLFLGASNPDLAASAVSKLSNYLSLNWESSPGACLTLLHSCKVALQSTFISSALSALPCDASPPQYLNYWIRLLLIAISRPEAEFTEHLACIALSRRSVEVSYWLADCLGVYDDVDGAVIRGPPVHCLQWFIAAIVNSCWTLIERPETVSVQSRLASSYPSLHPVSPVDTLADVGFTLCVHLTCVLPAARAIVLPKLLRSLQVAGKEEAVPPMHALLSAISDRLTVLSEPDVVCINHWLTCTNTMCEGTLMPLLRLAAIEQGVREGVLEWVRRCTVFPDSYRHPEQFHLRDQLPLSLLACVSLLFSCPDDDRMQAQCVALLAPQLDPNTSPATLSNTVRERLLQRLRVSPRLPLGQYAATVLPQSELSVLVQLLPKDGSLLPLVSALVQSSCDGSEWRTERGTLEYPSSVCAATSCVSSSLVLETVVSLTHELIITTPSGDVYPETASSTLGVLSPLLTRLLGEFLQGSVVGAVLNLWPTALMRSLQHCAVRAKDPLLVLRETLRLSNSVLSVLLHPCEVISSLVDPIAVMSEERYAASGSPAAVLLQSDATSSDGSPVVSARLTPVELCAIALTECTSALTSLFDKRYPDPAVMWSADALLPCHADVISDPATLTALTSLVLRLYEPSSGSTCISSITLTRVMVSSVVALHKLLNDADIRACVGSSRADSPGVALLTRFMSSALTVMLRSQTPCAKLLPSRFYLPSPSPDTPPLLAEVDLRRYFTGFRPHVLPRCEAHFGSILPASAVATQVFTSGLFLLNATLMSASALSMLLLEAYTSPQSPFLLLHDPRDREEVSGDETGLTDVLAGLLSGPLYTMYASQAIDALPCPCFDMKRVECLSPASVSAVLSECLSTDVIKDVLAVIGTSAISEDVLSCVSGCPLSLLCAWMTHQLEVCFKVGVPSAVAMTLLRDVTWLHSPAVRVEACLDVVITSLFVSYSSGLTSPPSSPPADPPLTRCITNAAARLLRGYSITKTYVVTALLKAAVGMKDPVARASVLSEVYRSAFRLDPPSVSAIGLKYETVGVRPLLITSTEKMCSASARFALQEYNACVSSCVPALLPPDSLPAPPLLLVLATVIRDIIDTLSGDGHDASTPFGRASVIVSSPTHFTQLLTVVIRTATVVTSAIISVLSTASVKEEVWSRSLSALHTSGIPMLSSVLERVCAQSASSVSTRRASSLPAALLSLSARVVPLTNHCDPLLACVTRLQEQGLSELPFLDSTSSGYLTAFSSQLRALRAVVSRRREGTGERVPVSPRQPVVRKKTVAIHGIRSRNAVIDTWMADDAAPSLNESAAHDKYDTYADLEDFIVPDDEVEMEDDEQ